MENQEIFNMACNPDPEVLAPMRVMQRQIKNIYIFLKKPKRDEKLAKTVRETSTSTREQRGQKRAFVCETLNTPPIELCQPLF
jgi:hypothetical protein